MGFWNALFSKEGRNSKTSETKGQSARPELQMTEAQRHDAFVQSLRTKASNGEYGPVVPVSPARRPSGSDDGGRERGDDPGAPGSLGRESGLKCGGSAKGAAASAPGGGKGSGAGHGSSGNGGGHGGHGSGNGGGYGGHGSGNGGGYGGHGSGGNSGHGGHSGH